MRAERNLARMAAPALRLQPDARLVKLTRDGHAQAFGEIVRRYRPGLLGFAITMVAATRAEDVVQEALARAFVALESSTGEMKLQPWLFTVVRNTALNDLRDEPRHEQLDEDWDGVPQPPDVVEQRQRLATLIAGIQALPAAQREALVGRELEGLGHAEIAAGLGMSPGAVRQLIFRARTALRNGAGSLIPTPALHALMQAGPIRAGAGVAAIGLTGGGGGLALKGAMGVVVAGLAIGSGVAIKGLAGDDPVATVAAAESPAERGARTEPGPTGASVLAARPSTRDGAEGHGDGGRDQGGPRGSGADSGGGQAQGTGEASNGDGDAGGGGRDEPGGDGGGGDGDGGAGGEEEPGGGGEEPPGSEEPPPDEEEPPPGEEEPPAEEPPPVEEPF